jgi:PAS domain-containing protein
LLTAQIGFSWWAYSMLARGARWLDDPRSCIIFLAVVPGLLAAGFAFGQALLWHALRPTADPTPALFGKLWVSAILGLLVPLPALQALITPILSQHGQIAAPPSSLLDNPWLRWTTGEIIEVVGLALTSAGLAVVLVHLKMEAGVPPWALWGVGLLIVVWAALRQGLRGGAIVSAASAVTALAQAPWLEFLPAESGPLQGYLLAQSSTAILVGASAGWIQASEARYRHVFNEIPLVLYSARLPRPLPVVSSDRPKPKRDSRGDMLGPTISREAIVTLVSPACRTVLERSPQELAGPYERWLALITPDDRELLIAALEQLGRQRQPVTCEYRLLSCTAPPATPQQSMGSVEPPLPRWVRDTLTPHYTQDGLLDGWEGFVEDVTERRKLSSSLHRSTMMLQALVANLPAGVFFVHGPSGFPLLANARARELLGQREDAAVPLSQLSRLYRLHRLDGSEYPAGELPVSRALRHGVRCAGNDIVVHRPDGRRITLVTWAAPVQLESESAPEAAVWVLEDFNAFQKAEAARRETEALLARVIETMAEGVLVQDASGLVIECNPAACAILGVPRYQVLGRNRLAPADAVGEDGQPLKPEESPDTLALRTGRAVRAAVIGFVPPGRTAPRWLLVNALPMPAMSSEGTTPRRVRLVTTFADITGHVTSARSRSDTPMAADLSGLLNTIQGLGESAQQSLPGDHPTLQAVRGIVELSARAAFLASQLSAEPTPAETTSPPP